MTSRYLMKVRALAAAAVAIVAIPMASPVNAQDAVAPTPTEELSAQPKSPPAPEPAAAATEDAPAEGSYEAFMAGPEAAMFTVNNLWILISAALVFIMHLGFASVESGMCQRKNTVNILFKNLFIVCIGAVGYMAWGFNAMYPGWEEAAGKFFALGSPLTNDFAGADVAANMTGEYADYTYWADFIFQAMFAATAATIVSGAVAERVKLPSFMIYATLLVTFLYPVTGSWEWGRRLAERFWW